MTPARLAITQTGATAPPVCSFRTLHTLYKLPTPPLNLRLSCAITVVETLLQLHTSGWLHKEFRSDNVLFIHTPEAQASVVSHKSDRDYLSFPPYVAGYLYARADDPLEATEPLESDLEADLYRHPASLGSAGGTRHLYCKAFDVFSVGCILLELGLWQSLATTLRNGASKECVREKTVMGKAAGSWHMLDLVRLRRDVLIGPIREPKVAVSGSVFEELAAAAGGGYCGMGRDMMSAFDGDQVMDVGAQSESDRNKRLLDLEMESLERLKAMVQVL